jgi:hypothetical protein
MIQEEFYDTNFFSKLERTKKPKLFKTVPPKVQQDLEFMIQVVRICASCYQYFPEEMKLNEEIIMIALKFNESLGEFIPKELISKTFIKKLIKEGISAHIINVLPKKDQIDREFLLDCIKMNKTSFSFCYDLFQQDTEFTSLILQSNGMDLKYLKEHKNNKDMVLIAIGENFESFQFADDVLKNNSQFLHQVFEMNGMCLKYSSNEIKDSKSMVLEAINQNPQSIQFASDNLKNDKDLLRICVNRDGLCLQHASTTLKEDEFIVRQAIKQNVNSLEFSSWHDWKEEEMLDIVQKNGMLLNFSSKWKEHFEISLEALKQIVSNKSLGEDFKIEFKKKILDANLKKNDLFIRNALDFDGRFLDFISDSDFSSVSKETYLKAVQKDKINFQYFFLNTGLFEQNKKEIENLFCEIYRCKDFKWESMINDLEKERNIGLKFIKTFKCSLEHFSVFNDDSEIVMESVKLDTYSVKFASKRLKDDPKTIMEVVKRNGKDVRFASERMMDNPKIAMEAVKSYGFSLKHLSKRMRNDLDIVMEAEKTSKDSLQYASEELKTIEKVKLLLESRLSNEKFKKVLINVIPSLGEDLDEDSLEKLKDDPSIMLELIKKNAYNLKFASNALKENKLFVMESIKQDSNSLRYVSDALKGDRDILLEAIKKNGYALGYASDLLKNDPKIVYEAVKVIGNSLRYASKELRANEEFMFEVSTIFGGSLKHASPEINKVKKIVMAAVREFGGALEYANEDLKNDEDVVMEAITHNVEFFAYSSKKLRSQKSVLKFIQKDLRCFSFLEGNLKENQEFIFECLDANPQVYQILSLEKKKNEEIALISVQKFESNFKYIPKELIDREFICKILIQNCKSFDFIGEEFANEREFIFSGHGFFRNFFKSSDFKEKFFQKELVAEIFSVTLMDVNFKFD